MPSPRAKRVLGGVGHQLLAHSGFKVPCLQQPVTCALVARVASPQPAIHHAATERLTGLANVYGQARPTYPMELVRWCLEQVSSPGLIVDLGCGTGISTRLFATTGHPVIGIDLNADLLATARGPSTDIGADRTPYLRIDHSISFHATRSETMCILF